MIRRRLVASTVILATLGSLSLGLAAPAGATTPRQVTNLSATGSPWFCVAVAELNFGYCQYDALA